MHRDGQVIFYNHEERSEFSVPAAELASSAVATAEGFRAAAQRVESRVMSDCDTADVQLIAEGLARIVRANRLHAFASNILRLCPDEHLTFIAAQDRSK